MRFTLYVNNTKENKDLLEHNLGMITDGGIKLVSLGTGKFIEHDQVIAEPLALRCKATPEVFLRTRNACIKENKVEPIQGWFCDGFPIERVYKANYEVNFKK